MKHCQILSLKYKTLKTRIKKSFIYHKKSQLPYNIGNYRMNNFQINNFQISITFKLGISKKTKNMRLSYDWNK